MVSYLIFVPWKSYSYKIKYWLRKAVYRLYHKLTPTSPAITKASNLNPPTTTTYSCLSRVYNHHKPSLSIPPLPPHTITHPLSTRIITRSLSLLSPIIATYSIYPHAHSPIQFLRGPCTPPSYWAARLHAHHVNRICHPANQSPTTLVSILCVYPHL